MSTPTPPAGPGGMAGPGDLDRPEGPNSSDGPARPDGPAVGPLVLVPGTPAGGPAARTSLAAAGARALVVPLLVTAPPADTAPLDEALVALAAGRYAHIAVTSAAGVAALLDAADRAGAALADLVATAGVRVAAVGPGTARALRDAGVVVDLVPPAAVAAGAAGLLAVWPPAPAAPPARAGDDAARRVLFPRGDRALPTLPAGLRARGWTVDEVVAYRTVDGPEPAPDVLARWRDGEVDGVLLTSPSAVEAVLARLGPPPATTRVACIGATTRDAAERAGLRVDAVADRPTAAALVAALLAVLTPAPSAPAPAPAPRPAPPAPDRRTP